MLEKNLESPLDSKEIKPVNPKGNQPWIFTGKTNVEAEVPILWPPDAKNCLIEKDPDSGKKWRQEEKGTTEDEMAGRHHRLNGHESEQVPGRHHQLNGHESEQVPGRHHRLNGHESEQVPGSCERLGSLACYSSRGWKESDMTAELNNNVRKW